jgi:hypothetical protein
VVNGALRRWLLSRQVDVDGLELRALVPVSVRGADGDAALGNQLTLVRGPLPVSLADPVAALRLVRESMTSIKESQQAIGAATLANSAELAPPGVLAQASRLQFSSRLFNLLVTNVPGPQFPLFLMGRQAVDLFPLPFLAEHHGLAVAIISYNGLIEWGLLADYDAVADVESIAEGIDLVLEDLLAAAAAADAVRDARRRRGETQRFVAPEADDDPDAGSGSTGPEDATATDPERPATDPKRPAAYPDPEAAASTTNPGLMSPTVPRRGGPGSDMRAKRRHP